MLVVAVVSLSTPLVGHHSFAEFYLEEDTIEVEGEILEVQYKNPHSWIHVQGEDAFGGRKSTPPSGRASHASSGTASPSARCARAIGSVSGRRRIATRTTTASASSESSGAGTSGAGARIAAKLVNTKSAKIAKNTNTKNTETNMRLVTRTLAAMALIAVGLSAVVRGQGGIASASARFLVSPQQVIAIRAGRLFDSRSGSLVTNQIVLIRGDRIADVGPSVAIPLTRASSI